MSALGVVNSADGVGHHTAAAQGPWEGTHMTDETRPRVEAQPITTTDLDDFDRRAWALTRELAAKIEADPERVITGPFAQTCAAVSLLANVLRRQVAEPTNVESLADARSRREGNISMRGPALNITGTDMYTLDTETGKLSPAGTGLGELSVGYTNDPYEDGEDCHACEGYGVPSGQSFDGPNCPICDGTGIKPSPRGLP